MREVDFIAFSDLQVEDWSRFSTNHSRLGHALKAVKIISKDAMRYKCPVLFCGDFFDNPKELSNLVISSTFINFHRTLGSIPVYAISGNHDQSESNTSTHQSPSHLDLYNYAFDNFHLIDGTFKDTLKGNYRIHGIPYLKDNRGFVGMVKKARKYIEPRVKNILLVHTDFHNITYNKKQKSGTIENLPRKLNQLFRGFDLILSGHIHTPQVIRKNIVMLGATNHQRVSDMGVKMGYWRIFKDLSYEFVPLGLPEFKIGIDKNDGNFYIPENTLGAKAGLDNPNESAREFTTTDIKALSTRYLKARGLSGRDKLEILEKYLSHGLS